MISAPYDKKPGRRRPFPAIIKPTHTKHVQYILCVNMCNDTLANNSLQATATGTTGRAL